MESSRRVSHSKSRITRDEHQPMTEERGVLATSSCVPDRRSPPCQCHYTNTTRGAADIHTHTHTERERKRERVWAEFSRQCQYRVHDDDFEIEDELHSERERETNLDAHNTSTRWSNRWRLRRFLRRWFLRRWFTRLCSFRRRRCSSFFCRVQPRCDSRQR